MTHPPHSADAVIARAAELCEAKGLRLTNLRRRAIAALAQAGRPVKAYDLLAELGEGEAPAKPASAYRALEFLESLGLVHRVSGINAFLLCTHGGGAHATQLFLCEECGAAEERSVHHTTPPETPAGFEVHRSVVEHYGLCRTCSTSAEE